MRVLLPILAIVLALLCLIWWGYVEYALQHYPGDGFGNLPADAPAFMRQAKHLLTWTVIGSRPTYFVFFGALVFRFRQSTWAARIAYVLLLLLFPLHWFILGESFILW